MCEPAPHTRSLLRRAAQATVGVFPPGIFHCRRPELPAGAGPGQSARCDERWRYIGMFIMGIPPISWSHIISWCSRVCAWSIMPIMFTAVTFPGAE